MSQNIAIAGASGAVGVELVSLLERRSYPLNNLRLLASSRSAGQKMSFRGEELLVEELGKDSFKGIDLAFFATSGSHAREVAPKIASTGTIVIDNSSAFRLDLDVPLVVPEVNPQAAKTHKGIIANPNCSTIQMVAALNPIHQYSNIKRIVVATYQAVSGAGKDAMEELNKQLSDIVNGETTSAKIFPQQIALNLIPHIDVFVEQGYTREEMKMVNETRKIFNSSEIQIAATCVRVPVMRAHSEAICIETEKKVTPEKARELISQTPGLKLVDEHIPGGYPTPLDATEQFETYVGRIREDISHPNGLLLWVVADQLWKGAALNAIQIAELLAE